MTPISVSFEFGKELIWFDELRVQDHTEQDGHGSSSDYPPAGGEVRVRDDLILEVPQVLESGKQHHPHQDRDHPGNNKYGGEDLNEQECTSLVSHCIPLVPVVDVRGIILLL